MAISIWNFTGSSASAAGLLRHMSNFRAVRPLQTHISWPWDSARSGGKMFYCSVNRGPGFLRLLDSPSLVAIALSAGNETWPPVGWHDPFVIGWSKYGLGMPQLQCIMSSPVGFKTIFQRSLTVPLHSPNGRQMTAVWAVQGECETV